MTDYWFLRSGTSADGITVAIAEILHEQTEDGSQDKIPPISIKQLAFETIPWPTAERELIFNMFSGSPLTLQQLCQANFQLGRAFADAVIKVVENNGFKLSEIDLIGTSLRLYDTLTRIDTHFQI